MRWFAERRQKAKTLPYLVIADEISRRFGSAALKGGGE